MRKEKMKEIITVIIIAIIGIALVVFAALGINAISYTIKAKKNWHTQPNAVGIKFTLMGSDEENVYAVLGRDEYVRFTGYHDDDSGKALIDKLCAEIDYGRGVIIQKKKPLVMAHEKGFIRVDDIDGRGAYGKNYTYVITCKLYRKKGNDSLEYFDSIKVCIDLDFGGYEKVYEELGG